MGPCQLVPEHSLGRGVGLVALDWQDQLSASPALAQACLPLGLLCSWWRIQRRCWMRGL